MKTAAIYHPSPNHLTTLLPLFQSALPNHRVIAWQDNISAEYLITWKPDEKIFTTSGLQIVFSLGAGVDAFLQAKTLDKHLTIVRLEEAGMGKQMLEIALYAILHYSRDMIALNQGQREKTWLSESAPKKLPFSTHVGIMGLGQLGRFVATSLANLGYPVHGYSRRLKSLVGVTSYNETTFDDFLQHSEVLINLLPLTTATENILNTDLFKQLPNGAYLVNLARGGHLQENDLIPALNSGQLSGALLDVFKTEPLPQNHPFWTDNRIIITPHLAAITLIDEAVKQISQNIIAYESGKTMTGIVDRQRGY